LPGIARQFPAIRRGQADGCAESHLYVNAMMASPVISNFKKIAKHYLGKIRAFGQVESPSSGLATDNGLPDWQKLLHNSETWKKSVRRTDSAPQVLIATSVGGLSAATIVEGMLGVALTLRGANVRFLLCDGVLPACLHVHLGKLSGADVIIGYRLKSEVCNGCLARGKSVYQSTGLPVSYYSEFVSIDELAELRTLADRIDLGEIRSYRKDGVAIGEHALAGALRFFATGNLPDTQEAKSVLRRYLESALITGAVMRRVLAQYRPQAAVFHHGIYVPQGIVGEVARSQGVRVANWQVAYRKKCFIFSHRETYHHTLIEEPTSTWDSIDWNAELDLQLLSYLRSRWYGSNDWIWFHDQPQHDASEISRETGIDFTKPTICLLTNVYWDAQLHFKANAFRDMLDWVLQTIQYFRGRPELQLVIRIHPAEIRGAIPSRQPILLEIEKAFPVLPRNTFVISPESQVSTYALCERCDSVIIYGTKTGVELTAMGIPVVVAGEAWIRNKGLTMDATSPGSYFAILDKLPLKHRLEASVVERAKKYAFHFFFRRFIPIKFMTPSTAAVPFEISIREIDDLMPGKDDGLDVICDGILHGSPFVHRAERHCMEQN
jgi:hypothetical protein